MEAEFENKYISDRIIYNVENTDYDIFITDLRRCLGEERSYLDVHITREFSDSAFAHNFIEVELQFYVFAVFVLVRMYDIYIFAFRKKRDASKKWYMLTFEPHNIMKDYMNIIPNVVLLNYSDSYTNLGLLEKVGMGFSKMLNAVQTLDSSDDFDSFKRPLASLCVFISESVRDRVISTDISEIMREYRSVDNYGEKWASRIRNWRINGQKVIRDYMVLNNEILTPRPDENEVQKVVEEASEFGMFLNTSYEKARKQTNDLIEAKIKRSRSVRNE